MTLDRQTEQGWRHDDSDFILTSSKVSHILSATKHEEGPGGYAGQLHRCIPADRLEATDRATPKVPVH